jgi:DNA-binding GntR family transcriptional regulator
MENFQSLFDDLERSGPVPLYFQIARKIEGAIESGMLPPGTKLDNEVKLAEDLKLSRPTVRRAIQELVTSGLLVRRRGIGTQVVHGKISRKVELSSLLDDLTRDKMNPRTIVLLHEVIAPPVDVAEALDLHDSTPVLHIKRLRLTGDDPIALLENYLPPELSEISAEQLGNQGLYQLLRAKGATMRVAKQRIGARAATKEEGEHFGRPVGSPVLTMTRTVYDNGGRAVEFGNHSYLPEMYSFEMTLVDR